MKEYLPYLVLIGGIATLLTYFLHRKNAKRVLLNEFSKKQVDLVSRLVDTLNANVFEIRFTTFGDYSSTATVYQANIFELDLLHITETDSLFFGTGLVFSKNSNQLFDFKTFLNNSFLPTEISVELEKFYTRHTSKVGFPSINGSKIVVVDSNYYEPNIYDKMIVKGFVIWEAQNFSFLNWPNFVECSKKLKNSVLAWLKKNNIKTININTHMAH